MRPFVQALYRITLKGIGAFGFLLFLTFLMVALPGGDPRDLSHPLPLAAMTVMAVSSLILAQFQSRLPSALTRPTRGSHAVAIFLTGTALAMATMLAVMIAVTSIGLGVGLDEATMKSITINTALVFGVFYAVAICLGAALSFWPVPQDDGGATA